MVMKSVAGKSNIVNKGENNMTNIFDVAKYIIQLHKNDISVMKLQKLCYYAQAWSLAWTDSPLFNEDFQAWANGPVCPELFYKTQGKYSVNADDIMEGEDNLSDSQKDIINRVFAHYGEHNAKWLGQLSIMEQPWIQAKNEINRIITKESMKEYYKNL